MTRWIVLALSALVLCTSPVVAKQSKCDITLQRIDALLGMYEKEHPLKHYPSRLKEFQNFAAKKGEPLDLSVFSKFSYKGTVLLSTCSTHAKTPEKVPPKFGDILLSIDDSSYEV